MGHAHLLAGSVALAPFAFALSAGCGDVFAQPIRDGTDAGIATVDGTLPDGPSTPVDGGTDEVTSCRSGVSIPLDGATLCTGDLARRFRFAACACDSFGISGSLLTDAFVSDAGASPSAASVAANANVASSGNIAISGSVWAAGTGPRSTPAVGLTGSGTVSHDIRSGGDMTAGGSLFVGGNVFVNGNLLLVDAGGSLTIDGGLHIAEGGTVSPGITVLGGVAREPVSIVPPCDCSHVIDIAGIIQRVKNANDNGAELSVTSLDYPSASVTLGCGRYYVSSIRGGNVDLVIGGKVGLFVDGPLSVDSELQVELAPGGELDLFVNGNATFGSGASFGNLNSPARVRLYVGGALGLGMAVNIGANVYAPNTTLTPSSDFVMWGAILANGFQCSATCHIYYDPEVLGAAASGCTPPGGPCATCDDCPSATPACIGGTCTECTKDVDCCAPLTCRQGRCVQPQL